MAKLSKDKIEWILSLNATQVQEKIQKKYSGHILAVLFLEEAESKWRRNILIINKTKKPSDLFRKAIRGSKRIRTAVNGFADRYLTTRTWNLS